jgi:hypothetical protein
MKICALVVPKEMKLEHQYQAGIKAMSDEQLEAGIAALQDLLERRAAAAKALPDPKVIEGEAVKPKDD